MPDALTIAAALVVAGPVVGTVCLAYPPFVRVWTAPREEHLALVAAHRVAWRMANVGFTVATVFTAAGLVVLAGSIDVVEGQRAVLATGAVAYAIAGSLWCAILAIRTRITPAIAAMVAVPRLRGRRHGGHGGNAPDAPPGLPPRPRLRVRVSTTPRR